MYTHQGCHNFEGLGTAVMQQDTRAGGQQCTTPVRVLAELGHEKGLGVGSRRALVVAFFF
jgi:hypothetical protein